MREVYSMGDGDKSYDKKDKQKGQRDHKWDSKERVVNLKVVGKVSMRK